MSSENKINNSAKILHLYKRQYADNYRDDLNCEYSCLGYFDGMDITDVYPNNSTLCTREKNTFISDIWYQKASYTQQSDNYSSEQSIGIFRNNTFPSKNKELSFWCRKTSKAFLTVCFIQMNQSADINLLSDSIEAQRDNSVDIITYFTFDNADVIVFLKSNDITLIAKKLNAIINDPDILYAYPLYGISDSILEKFNEQPVMQYKDSHNNIIYNKRIKELRINIIGNTHKFEHQLKNKLDTINYLKNYNKSTYTYLTTHEKCILSIRDTDVYTILKLLAPNGFLSHKNEIFGKYLYNMETQLIFEEVDFKTTYFSETEITKTDLKDNSQKSKDTVSRDWCRTKILVYQEYMKNSFDTNDECMYSLYQSMIKTLKSLIQYEEFSFSKNIFNMIFPALRFFDEQLSHTFKNQQTGIVDTENKETITATFCDFLHSINSIIYHSIHTDQVFFMIPGYCGTSFTIPSKLSTFYLWYINKVINILNDHDHKNNYKYRIYLNPVIESKPLTYVSELGLPVGDRLICVKVSQRSLYMPKHLLIILTHEMAHYVGDKIRNRKERISQIIITLSYIIAEAIIPFSLIEKNKPKAKIYECLLNQKNNIFYLAKDTLENYFKLSQIESEEYYATIVAKQLMNCCANILVDENKDLQRIITDIPDRIYCFCDSYEQKINEIEYYETIIQGMNSRKLRLLASGTLDDIIIKLLKEYQEIFADAIAILLSGMHEKDYIEAFNISEGVLLTKSITARTLVISQLFFSEGHTNSILNSGYHLPDEHADISTYWQSLDVVPRHMCIYLNECIKLICSKLEDKSEYWQEIKHARQIFTDEQFSETDIWVIKLFEGLLS